jgi:hypothetical protein
MACVATNEARSPVSRLIRIFQPPLDPGKRNSGQFFHTLFRGAVVRAIGFVRLGSGGRYGRVRGDSFEAIAMRVPIE